MHDLSTYTCVGLIGAVSLPLDALLLKMIMVGGVWKQILKNMQNFIRYSTMFGSDGTNHTRLAFTRRDVR